VHGISHFVPILLDEQVQAPLAAVEVPVAEHSVLHSVSALAAQAGKYPDLH